MISRFLIQLPLCLVLLVRSALIVKAAKATIAKRGCKDTCGNVSIPFPFGLSGDCALDHRFLINCSESPKSEGFPKPFLSEFNIELKEVTKDIMGNQRVIVGIPPVNACTADTQSQQPRGSSIDLRGSPYNFSILDNIFFMDGCSGGALLLDQNNQTMSDCGDLCGGYNYGKSTNSCTGVELQLNSATDFPFYQVEFNESSGELQNCLVATLIQNSSAQQYTRNLSTPDLSSAVPVVLHWSWISNLLPDSDGHNASCSRRVADNTLVCACFYNFFGNPYVYGGCQVPDECKDCQGPCYALADSYYCTDEKPMHFNTLATIVGLNLCFGILFLVISGYFWIHRLVKRAREMKQRENFFRRNGGLLLQKHLSSHEGFVQRIKTFSAHELDKASDNFSKNRILGQGGQGTVYKGILTDGRIVAIKKTRVLDGNQLGQFINEVVILSQINHRNVVKLLGCCLETEVPLLVYEFIPNGTLYQNIHGPVDDDFFISWEMRLKIAADSAGAIAYLHSSASVPIYHRDIKSSNILLDGKHRAKVSDFGCSKTIAVDQTHLTTLVKGTWGYFDPEYFQTHQFTEKSDVYSFGVLLVELLTSKKSIYTDESTMEPVNLASQFLLLMGNSSLSHILDPKIVKDAKEEELMAVAELARRCLSGSGRLRPTMKEVASTLEMIIKSSAEVPTLDEQALLYKEFGESVMAESEISDAEFMSNPFPASAVSPS